jgi:hypothetical protein
MTQTKLCYVPFLYREMQDLLKRNGKITFAEDVKIYKGDKKAIYNDCAAGHNLTDSEKITLRNAVEMVTNFIDRFPDGHLRVTPEVPFNEALLSVPNVNQWTVDILKKAGFTDYSRFKFAANSTALTDSVEGRAGEIMAAVMQKVILTPQDAAQLWSSVMAICDEAKYYYWGYTNPPFPIPGYNPPA